METAGGARFLEYNGMIGWDGLEKTYVSGGFNSLGGHTRAMWSRSGDEWHMNATSIKADGSKETSTLVLSDISEDTFRTQSTNRKRGDEERPDAPKSEWKRVK